MLEESNDHAHDHAHDTEIEKIDAAADLLRRMLSELKEIAVESARVHFAMSGHEHGIRQRLDMLCGIVELLKTAQEPLRARELSQRARALIRHLSGELEHLALEAEHDFDWIT